MSSSYPFYATTNRNCPKFGVITQKSPIQLYNHKPLRSYGDGPAGFIRYRDDIDVRSTGICTVEYARCRSGKQVCTFVRLCYAEPTSSPHTLYNTHKASTFIEVRPHASRVTDRRPGEAWYALSMAALDNSEMNAAELGDLVWALSLSETESTQALAATRAIPGDDSPQDRAGHGLVNFKKTWMYANSRLPPFLPPMIVYMPTWRLLCLAAQASLNVYNKPRPNEKEHFIDANWQNSTKAMVVQSRPIDDQNFIVFAIRGSQMNFVDWSINFRPAPVFPSGFIDDAGNACHAGFLTVAKAMVKPVAARLRQLLEQDPSRIGGSLLITGHSAGGAVAALLYAHMLSQNVRSELKELSNLFKRIHCVTFGAPPLTLLPLQKPSTAIAQKSIFMSFINEGDPVARAEKAYVVSLAHVLAASAPKIDKNQSKTLKNMKSRLLRTTQPSPVAPYWPVPPATLSNAGRTVVLREKPSHKGQIEAVITSDEQLRDVLFGDPAMHAMTLYKSRIDALAFAAVTGVS